MRPTRRALAGLAIALSLASGAGLGVATGDAPPVDPFARVAAGDAAGALAALAPAYRSGALDLKAARLYQDLRLEAGERDALLEETKAAFPEPSSSVGRILLARLAPRRECDAALQRLVPDLGPDALGLVLLDQLSLAVRADELPHATTLLPRTKRLTADLEETAVAEARLLEASGERAGAERILAAYGGAHPDASDARVAWVRVLVGLRRLGDAAAVAEQGLARARSPAFLAARAVVAFEVHDLDLARRLLEEAKDAGRPAVRAEVLALRAATRLAARDAAGAESAARAAVAACPTCVPALRALARVLEVAGRHGDALERLDAALEARPAAADVLVDRAVVLHAMGRTRDAKKTLADARRRDPGATDALHWQGVIAEDEGDWSGAEKAYRAALKADPDRLETHRMLGGVLVSLGRLDHARAEAEWIQARYPKDPHAWFLTGRLELKADKADEAMVAFEKAVAADPGYALGHVGRGWVLEEQQRPEEAQKAYLAAIAADPRLPLPNRYLGELLEERGENGEAAKRYKAYLDLGGADPDEDIRHAVERLSK